jgi:hypothetical protein
MIKQNNNTEEELETIIKKYRDKWRVESYLTCWWEKAFRDCFEAGVNSQQEIKKDSSLPMGNYLGSRREAGEENNIEGMPVDTDNQFPADIHSQNSTPETLDKKQNSDTNIQVEIVYWLKM